MRRALLAGNWKMNLGLAESLRLAEELRQRLTALPDRDVAIFPTFVSVAAVAKALGESRIRVGGQDCAAQQDGAFTGAVSATILRSSGASMVILGHSERRHVFGETDAAVAAKLRQALAAGLTPILCVGETQAERDALQTASVVLRQLNSALDGLGKDDLARLVLAYEPVWAIGTGRSASPAQAQEVHALLRGALKERAGALAEDLRILYGGSVKGANIDTLMREIDIDGALVGGAALQADEFVRIVSFQNT
ncbi:MAG: triose-phosphate isomerase [Planctomycetes bacterium]|nr:triose-phosphate isomerase [Planctomycetota bacterium]